MPPVYDQTGTFLGWCERDAIFPSWLHGGSIEPPRLAPNENLAPHAQSMPVAAPWGNDPMPMVPVPQQQQVPVPQQQQQVPLLQQQQVPVAQQPIRIADCHSSTLEHYGPVFASHRDIFARPGSKPYIHGPCGASFGHPADVKRHAESCGCFGAWNEHESCHLTYQDIHATKCADGYILLDQESWKKLQAAEYAGLQYKQRQVEAARAGAQAMQIEHARLAAESMPATYPNIDPSAFCFQPQTNNNVSVANMVAYAQAQQALQSQTMPYVAPQVGNDNDGVQPFGAGMMQYAGIGAGTMQYAASDAGAMQYGVSGPGTMQYAPSGPGVMQYTESDAFQTLQSTQTAQPAETALDGGGVSLGEQLQSATNGSTQTEEQEQNQMALSDGGGDSVSDDKDTDKNIAKGTSKGVEAAGEDSAEAGAKEGDKEEDEDARMERTLEQILQEYDDFERLFRGQEAM